MPNQIREYSERNVGYMVKKIQLIIICVLALLLIFLLADKNKSVSKSTTSNQQMSEQRLENDLEDGIAESEDTKKDKDTSHADQSINDESTSKTVYLTFDDGPSSASNEIIDTLDQFNAKATFFMLEPAMRMYPEVVNRTVKEGHAVGLHGVTHERDKFYQSEQSALNEMNVAQETLEEISGVHSNLVRTPYGSIPYLTDSFRTIFDENGLKLWDWNVDSSDWSLSKDEYVQNVISQVEKLNKDGVAPIILMHDQDETAHHLSNLLHYLREHNYQTKKIDENLEPYNFNCYDRCYRLEES